MGEYPGNGGDGRPLQLAINQLVKVGDHITGLHLFQCAGTIQRQNGIVGEHLVPDQLCAQRSHHSTGGVEVVAGDCISCISVIFKMEAVSRALTSSVVILKPSKAFHRSTSPA